MAAKKHIQRLTEASPGWMLLPNGEGSFYWRKSPTDKWIVRLVQRDEVGLFVEEAKAVVLSVLGGEWKPVPEPD